MTKRVLSMLLCLVMVCSLFPAFSIEADAASYDDLRAAAEAASKMTWYWPISEGKGSVSSSYGFRDGGGVFGVHYGMDIGSLGRKGKTAVYPIQTGTVVYVHPTNDGGAGRYVVIRHDVNQYNGNPFYSKYFHLHTVTVEEGQKVTLDTKIGTAGGSGQGYDSRTQVGTNKKGEPIYKGYPVHLHLQIHYGDKDSDKGNSSTINPCEFSKVKIGDSFKKGRPMENGKDYENNDASKKGNCGKKFEKNYPNIFCITYTKIKRSDVSYINLCEKTSFKNNITLVTNSEAEIRNLPCDETTLELAEKQYKSSTLGTLEPPVAVNKDKPLTALQLVKNTDKEYWYTIQYDNKTAYIASKYVSKPSTLTIVDRVPCAVTLKVTADNATKNTYPANDSLWSNFLGNNEKEPVAKNTGNLKAKAICLNVFGNYWYELEDKSYIPADKVKTTLTEPKMLVDGMSPKDTIGAASNVGLRGTVSSDNLMPITSVEVSVTDASGKQWGTAKDNHFTLTNPTYFYEIGHVNELSNCCDFKTLPTETYTYTVKGSFQNSYSDDGKKLKTATSTAEKSVTFKVIDDFFFASLKNPVTESTNLTVTFSTPWFSKLEMKTKDNKTVETSTKTFKSDAYIRSGESAPYAFYYRVKDENGNTCYVSAEHYKSHTTNENPSVTLNKKSANKGTVTVSGSVQGPSWMTFKEARIDSTTTCNWIKEGSFTEQLAETFKAGTYNISANASYTYSYVNAKQNRVIETVTTPKKLKFTVSSTEAPQTTPTPTPDATSSPTPDATSGATTAVQGSEYLKQCEITPTYLYLTATTSKNNSVMTLPCSKGTNSNSKQVKALTSGEKMTARELVRNSVGNYWYKVVLPDGRTGYATGNLNTPATNYQPDNALTITLPDIKTHTSGKTHTVTGTVKRYTALDGEVTVTGTLYQPNGNKASSGSLRKNADSISLKGSKVDEKLEFADLNIGECRMTVTATMDIPYTPDGKKSSTLSISASQTDYFTVGKTRKIKYDANGGSKAPSAQNVAYGNTVTLSRTIPVRSGFEFLGWSETKGAETATYKAGGTIQNVKKDITLYAVWDIPLFIDEENFPDPNFRSLVSREYDTDGDGVLSHDEISEVRTIYCSYMSISSLKGLEYFTELQALECDLNQLKSLDVSKNTMLTDLWVQYNQLTNLDVSHNLSLKELRCHGNQLTNLDLSKNAALEWMNCAGNQLTNLDLSKNAALEWMNCADNQLTNLDVSRNTALERLYCDYNQLTSLDLSKNTALKWLNCAGNQLTNLDVSKNTALTELDCYDNRLTALDVSKNTALIELECQNNQLTSLDLSNNTALTALGYDNNERMVETESNRFDLSTLPGFDISRASNWEGGTLDGSILTFTSNTVTYTYDLRNGSFENPTFTLITEETTVPGEAPSDFPAIAKELSESDFSSGSIVNLRGIFTVPEGEENSYGWGFAVYRNGEWVNSYSVLTIGENNGKEIVWPMALVPGLTYTYRACIQVVDSNYNVTSVVESEPVTFTMPSEDGTIPAIAEEQEFNLGTGITNLYKFTVAEAGTYEIRSSGNGSFSVYDRNGYRLGYVYSSDPTLTVTGLAKGDTLWLAGESYNPSSPMKVVISNQNVASSSITTEEQSAESAADDSVADDEENPAEEIPEEQMTEDLPEVTVPEELPAEQMTEEQPEQPAEKQEAEGDPEGNNVEPVEAAPVEQVSEDPAEAEESADNEADEEPAGIEPATPEETGENVREEQEAVQAEA